MLSALNRREMPHLGLAGLSLDAVVNLFFVGVVSLLQFRFPIPSQQDRHLVIEAAEQWVSLNSLAGAKLAI